LSKGFSETIDAIRQRVNIVDIVSQHLTLKKAGKNYRALCPFHHEKTPSFMVNEEKQIFHCFGCGVGGDVFTFLMRYENLTFYDALTDLARRAGVTVPKGTAAPEADRKREILLEINQKAADYFHRNLLNKKIGADARAYLASRGIREKVIQEYQLGYAPAGWTNLVSHFRDRGVDLRMAQTLGLIIPRKQEGWYDQFRNRVIFPIRNTAGLTVGLGGRVIDDGTPKYLNSADSLVYKKGQSIFGIHRASQAIRQRDLVLVVEGYFDVLTLHQNGLQNAVAPLGTALTQDQVRIMKRYTRNFVLLFDPDEAGTKAMFRAFDVFIEEDIHPKVVRLPDGRDPDSFVREEGGEALVRAVEGAVPLMDAFVEYAMERGTFKTVEGKVQIGRAVLPMLEKLRDPVERRLYGRSVAERLGVQEADLLPASGKRRPVRDMRDQKARGIQPKGHFPAPEEALVEVMLNHADLIPMVFERGAIDDFESEELGQVARILRLIFEEKGEVSMGDVLARISDEGLRNRISFWALSGRFKEEELEKTVGDCIRQVRRSRLRRDQDLITRRIQEAEKADQTALVSKLLREKQRLIDQERSLRTT
jgi:DNA primase